MAITDRIRRDLGHPFNPDDPSDLIVFRQHGCSIPSCTDLGARIPLSATDPQVLGGEGRDKILNLIVPELAWPGGVAPVGAPAVRTPDIVRPTRTFFRQMSHGINIPDGRGGTVEMWSFDDTGPGGRTGVFPAPTIRAVEGDIVHTTLTTRRGTHTIHHHAIEPSTMNDGVGHISFEVDGGGYTYQWRASEAGTYFYHCHKNTVLHFEMGMYGFLIIDPKGGDAPYEDGGPGRVRVGNDKVDYDIERMWAVDEIDSRWHDIISQDVAAGVACDFFHATIDGTPIPGELNNPVPFGKDPFMHRFDPDIFCINGIAVDQNASPPVINENNDPADLVHIRARRGERVLLRLLCAGYNTHVYRIGVPSTLIEVDARTLGYGDRQQYSSPIQVPANQPFELSTARRKTFLIDTADLAPGEYPIRVDFFDWVSGERKGQIFSGIRVLG